MDLRKVIKFGRATYSITLPKKWVTEHRLEKGDVVRVEQLSSGKLEVTPRDAEKSIEVKTIDISADQNEVEDIFREVVAAYIKNYTIINIKGDIKGKIKQLRAKLQELVGLEIMEVSPRSIMAKSFLDVTETKVELIVKRIYYILKSMCEEFKNIVAKEGSLEEIQEMDREVNRNSFFTWKFLYKALESPEFATKRGLKNYDIVLTWELVKLLENMADKLKMMADVLENQEVLVSPDAKNKFMKIFNETEQTIYLAMDKYFKKSKQGIPEIFNKIEQNDKSCNKFLAGHKKAWTPLLIDHLKDVNHMTKHIAEIIIDFE
ncbi:AbrB/MazE/SpoVT family DNA-binding domain-containing protein [Nanoarchaeota archaeon]